MKKMCLTLLMAGFLAGCSTPHCTHTPEIKYSRVNGFKGFSDVLQVTSQKEFYSVHQRRETVSSKNTKLTQAEYCHLDELLHKADVFSLPSEYKSEHEIYDMPCRVLEVSEYNKTKKIRIDAFSHPPKELEEVIEYLRKLETEKFPIQICPTDMPKN